MKLLVNSIVMVLILLAVVVSAAEKKPAGKHLFILSGQSNMARMNPQRTFIPTVTKAFGKEHVIVVKSAQGGQPIRQWYKQWKDHEGNKPESTGGMYDKMMGLVNTAIKGQSIRTVTFVWMQGENDARTQAGKVYEASLNGLLEQLATDLKRKDIHFVIGRLSDCGVKGKKRPTWNLIRQAQVKVAESSPRGAWVDTDDLNDGVNAKGQEIKDNLHYSVKGYDLLGQRFAEQAIRLVHANDR